MRIPDSTAYLSFLSDLQRTQEQLAKAQSEVTTGRKVNKPSDDPLAASDIVRLSTDQALDDQFGKNVASAKSNLTAADAALGSVEQLVERVHVLGLQALGDTANASAYSTEIAGLRDQIISAANTQNAGRYIFGGSATTTNPFVKAADSSVSYVGNSLVTSIQVGRETTLQTQVPGDQIFNAPVNVFSTVSDLLAAMQSGDHAGIDAQVKNLEAITTQISTARSLIGGSINVADTISATLSQANLAHAKELNDVQNADTAQAITQLSLSQTSLQATLAVGAKIAHMSLLDYLN